PDYLFDLHSFPTRRSSDLVFVFDKNAVYGDRQTPRINEQALKDLDLVGRTAGGTASGPITITDRVFGWAAARVPKLTPEVGIVRSEEHTSELQSRSDLVCR